MYLLEFLCLYLTTGGCLCLLRLVPPRLQTSTANSAEKVLLLRGCQVVISRIINKITRPILYVANIPLFLDQKLQ